MNEMKDIKTFGMYIVKNIKSMNVYEIKEEFK